MKPISQQGAVLSGVITPFVTRCSAKPQNMDAFIQKHVIGAALRPDAFLTLIESEEDEAKIKEFLDRQINWNHFFCNCLKEISAGDFVIHFGKACSKSKHKIDFANICERISSADNWQEVVCEMVANELPGDLVVRVGRALLKEDGVAEPVTKNITALLRISDEFAAALSQLRLLPKLEPQEVIPWADWSFWSVKDGSFWPVEDGSHMALCNNPVAVQAASIIFEAERS